MFPVFRIRKFPAEDFFLNREIFPPGFFWAAKFLHLKIFKRENFGGKIFYGRNFSQSDFFNRKNFRHHKKITGEICGCEFFPGPGEFRADVLMDPDRIFQAHWRTILQPAAPWRGKTTPYVPGQDPPNGMRGDYLLLDFGGHASPTVITGKGDLFQASRGPLQVLFRENQVLFARKLPFFHMLPT